MWRDFAIGLSLANLCYLRIWSEILTYQREETYWMKLPPTPSQYAAVICNVLFFGCVLGIGITAVRRMAGGRGMRWARWVFVLFLLIPANAFRAVLGNRWDFLRSGLFGMVGNRGVIAIGAALVLIGIFVMARWHGKLLHALPALAYILFPFVPVTVAQAVWMARKYDPTAFLDRPLPAKIAASSSRRVLWIVFDELDQRLAFVDRPGIELPEFDRLRAQSVYAPNAFPPGEGTPVSMPAYILGHRVEWESARAPDRTELKFPDRPEMVPFADQPNVFSKARVAGFNTALVGWYHPYCRVLEANLNECAWWEMARQYNSMGATFGDIAVNQTRSLFESTLFSVFGQSLATEYHARTYHEMLSRTKQVAVDRQIGLTLAHLPVPHGPHAFDRRTGRFTLRNSPILGYVGSLVLTDRTLRELRETMESAGVWENTTVVVTADHHFREDKLLDGKTDLRVPFLLKLAGRKKAATYGSSFNTSVTADLVLAILRGDVPTAADVAAWLDHHR